MKRDETEIRLRELCAAHHLKCTAQRLAVYRYIHGNTSHPGVDRIWYDVRQKIPSITRESVFRILTELCDLGVIARLDKIINARFDGLPHNHGHMICENCGAVLDFELPDSPPIPKSPDFQVSRVELRLTGLCRKCAEMKAKNNPGKAKRLPNKNS